LFEQFSERARQVVYLARMYAGKTGAPDIDLAHLVEALVREDQGEFRNIVSREIDSLPQTPSSFVSVGLRRYRPFFSSEAAAKILLRLDQLFTNAQAIPHSADMPVSAALGRTFAAATALRVELNQEQVEPLHLLAAVLSEESSQACDVVKRVGISRDAVITAIQTGS